MDANISAWIDLSLWRWKRCHEHSMVNFVSTHDYLILPICVCIPKQTWAQEGCTSANFSQYIFRTKTKTSSAKDQRIHYMITKYFHAPWNYQMNLLVSLWFLFCYILFSFGTNLWPHAFTKNTGKAFIHMTKINCLVTTLYEVFNRLQPFLFFFLFWKSTRESKENTFCTLW